MAMSVLPLSLVSLRSRSRLRSQLGFFGWMLVRSCRGQRSQRASLSRRELEDPLARRSSSPPGQLRFLRLPDDLHREQSISTHQLFRPPRLVLRNHSLRQPLDLLLNRVLLLHPRMLPRAPRLGIIVPKPEDFGPARASAGAVRGGRRADLEETSALGEGLEPVS